MQELHPKITPGTYLAKCYLMLEKEPRSAAEIANEVYGSTSPRDIKRVASMYGLMRKRLKINVRMINGGFSISDGEYVPTRSNAGIKKTEKKQEVTREVNSTSGMIDNRIRALRRASTLVLDAPSKTAMLLAEIDNLIINILTKQ